MAAVPTNSSVVKGQAATPSTPLRPSRQAKIVTAAMAAHFREKSQDSIYSDSPAWKDARIAIRHLKYVSPLILGIIQQPGSFADLAERKKALDFLVSSADALAAVMADKIAPPDINLYDRIELNGTLASVVGKLWEQSGSADPVKRIDDLVATVSAVYSDVDFAEREKGRAEKLREAIGYLHVDSEEKMDALLRQSLYAATMHFYQAVVDERLGNGKGVFFTYGKKAVEVTHRMRESFDGVMAEIIAQHTFAPAISNDQRTRVMQSWMHNGSMIYQSEYVAQTMRLMNWFREGKGEEFSARYAQAKGRLGEVLTNTARVTAQTMGDLIAVADGRYAEEQQERESARAAAPR